MYRFRLFMMSLVDDGQLIARVINKLNLAITGLGYSEIDAILPGYTDDWNCPLANTFASAIFQPVRVCSRHILTMDRGMSEVIAKVWDAPAPFFNGVEYMVRMPPEMMEFVRRFDQGFLKQLVDNTPTVKIIPNSSPLADTNWLERLEDHFELDFPPVA